MDECSCIRGKYDFKIDTLNCDAILYQDLSDWMDEHSIPEFYTISITTPKNTTPIHLQVELTGVSIIRPEEIGLTGLDGIDGVYCFTTNSCGVEYTKTKAVTCRLECKLDHMIAQGINTPGQLKEAEEIERYIKAIHYNAERNFVEEAKFFYNRASERLSCKNCEC